MLTDVARHSAWRWRRSSSPTVPAATASPHVRALPARDPRCARQRRAALRGRRLRARRGASRRLGDPPRSRRARCSSWPSLGLRRQPHRVPAAAQRRRREPQRPGRLPRGAGRHGRLGRRHRRRRSSSRSTAGSRSTRRGVAIGLWILPRAWRLGARRCASWSRPRRPASTSTRIEADLGRLARGRRRARPARVDADLRDGGRVSAHLMVARRHRRHTGARPGPRRAPRALRHRARHAAGRAGRPHRLRRGRLVDARAPEGASRLRATPRAQPHQVHPVALRVEAGRAGDLVGRRVPQTARARRTAGTSSTSPQLAQMRWWWCSVRSSASSKRANSPSVTMRWTRPACSSTTRFRYTELCARPRPAGSRGAPGSSSGGAGRQGVDDRLAVGGDPLVGAAATRADHRRRAGRRPRPSAMAWTTLPCAQCTGGRPRLAGGTFDRRSLRRRRESRWRRLCRPAPQSRSLRRRHRSNGRIVDATERFTELVRRPPDEVPLDEAALLIAGPCPPRSRPRRTAGAELDQLADVGARRDRR